MKEIQGKRVESFEEMNLPGDFLWLPEDNPARLMFLCPCGCGAYLGVSVRGDESKHPVWDWDQNLERPTIKPSIKFIDGCNWHGFLKNGKFETC